MSATQEFQVRIPDDRYWREQVKCQSACPVHTDAHGYIRAIAEGDIEKAYLIARGPNPLASICGRICGTPCELNCRRGALDAPVSIRALKRYSHELFTQDGVTRQLNVIQRIKERYETLEGAGGEELGALESLFDGGHFARASGQRIAIIGSGPAGLAAAHDLALFGFAPVIFEMEPVAAGMLYLGVPEYRLPRALIQAEVDAICSMGVTIKTEVTVGKDVTIPELLHEFAAVIIAVGAKKSRSLPVKGSEGRGVYGGVDFLRAAALRRPIAIGKEVVVIGGGNVAYDVSRTALRHEVESDVSRTALRYEGVKTVHLCCLEARGQMLADEHEIVEGGEEGVILHNSFGPDEILLNEDGDVRGVRLKKVVSIFDDNGRFAPTYDDTNTIEIGADTVLVAIGQDADCSFVDPERDRVRLTERGSFVLNDALSTTRPGLFAAGDVAYGPKLMIHAIASGKRVARSVYEYVTGVPLRWNESGRHFPLAEYSRKAHYEVAPRRHPETLTPQLRSRTPSVEVEQCFSTPSAIAEAERCLDCAVNTIFDSGKCILCGGCAEICPEQCLKLINLDRAVNDADFLPLSHTFDSEAAGSLSGIIKNDERCTRCGLCAERCPVGAITMERYLFQPICNGNGNHG